MTFTIESRKTKREIIALLKSDTHEDIPLLKLIRDDNSYSRYFRGTIGTDSFRIQRCFVGATGLIPIAYGTFSESGSGTSVTVKMRLCTPARIFLPFWFSGTISFCVLFPLLKIPARFCLIPFAMLIYGIHLLLVPSIRETGRVRNKLAQILGQ